MADLMCCLTNVLYFDTPLLYYYLNTSFNNFPPFEKHAIFLTLTLIHQYTSFLGTNLNSSIICCLSFGDMYLFL